MLRRVWFSAAAAPPPPDRMPARLRAANRWSYSRLLVSVCAVHAATYRALSFPSVAYASLTCWNLALASSVLLMSGWYSFESL